MQAEWVENVEQVRWNGGIGVYVVQPLGNFSPFRDGVLCYSSHLVGQHLEGGNTVEKFPTNRIHFPHILAIQVKFRGDSS